jgi:hypothetical protein
MWEQQQNQMGSRIVVEWDGLLERYRKPLIPQRSLAKL